MRRDEYNERGYFESVTLMKFHDEILASAGSTWDDWREFNPHWVTSPVAAALKSRAYELFRSEFDDSPIPVLKDPRICRFAPFWLGVLRDKQHTPHVAVPVRSPLDVALSLKRRNGFSLTKGLLLWLRHSLDAELSTRQEARSIVLWDEFVSNWRRVCDKIATDTRLSWPRLSDRSAHVIDRFVSRELVHHETDHGALIAHPDAHEWAVRTYEALNELNRNPLSNSAVATLDQIRAMLNESGSLFGRLLIDYEISIEELQDRTRALTDERNLLRTRQDEIAAERDAARGDGSSRAGEFERTLSKAASDRGALIQALDSMRAERDALTHERASLVAELQARQRELGDLSARAVEFERVSSKAASDREALSQALASTRAERETLADDLTRLSAELDIRLRDLNELSTRAAEFETAIDEATRDGKALSRALAAREDELTDALRRSGEVESERHAISAALERVRTEKAKAEVERANMAETLARTRQDRDDLATRLDQSGAELQAQRKLADDDAVAANARHALALDGARREQDRRMRALRDQLVDTEAALSNATTKRARSGLFLALSRTIMARKLVRSGLLDPEWYSATYPDVRDSGLRPATHYLEIGFAKGYKPNAFFETRFYLEQNEDVRRSGLNPLLHYLMRGWKEGRDPGPDFQTNYYLEVNPDVRATGVNPLAHYLRTGRHEGRLPAQK